MYRSHIKPRIAFFDFTGCEGCQLSVIDSLQTHPELLEAVDIVNFREAISEKSNHYQIAFIEGGITRRSDEKRLLDIRERAGLIIALGACAHLGGINAIRNMQSQLDVQRYVYGTGRLESPPTAARPIEALVPVDGFIPGCPIDQDEFIRVVSQLLQSRTPWMPDYPICVECKLKEKSCLLQRGMICLGPITRAGCGAICPTYNQGCEGCRGLFSTPNFSGLKYAMREYGLSDADLTEKIELFQTYQLSESERVRNDRHTNKQP